MEWGLGRCQWENAGKNGSAARLRIRNVTNWPQISWQGPLNSGESMLSIRKPAARRRGGICKRPKRRGEVEGISVEATIAKGSSFISR